MPFVHIIESPSDQDLINNHAEGRALCEALHASGIPSRYCTAASYRTFSLAMTRDLTDAWNQFRQPPVLHLAMHGSRDGLGFTNGDVVTWETLRLWLSYLNSYVGGQLLVGLSACFGSAGIAMSMNNDVARPFGTLVGNRDTVALGDLIVGFTTFYHLLLVRQRSLTDAVAAMRQASGNDRFASFGDAWVQQLWREMAFSTPAPAPTISPPPGLATGLAASAGG